MTKWMIVACLISRSVCAQETDVWKILSEVNFETTTAGDSGFEMDSPKFSKKLWSYNGKKVQLKGYMIPVSETKGKTDYMISSLPFNSCYFCGGAGPETVVEVQTKEKLAFTNKLVTMEGILFLNDFDPDHHMYMIKDAKLIN
jgi:hypothetical protein